MKLTKLTPEIEFKCTVCGFQGLETDFNLAGQEPDEEIVCTICLAIKKAEAENGVKA